MHHVLVVRELISRDITGGSVNKLRDAVDEGRAGQLDRRGLVDDAGGLRLAVERPDVAVYLILVVDLADALGLKRDSPLWSWW